MKLSIPANTLLPVVSALKGLQGTTRTMPSTNFFLLRSSAEGLSLTATNLEIEMVCQLADIKAETEGEALVSAEKIYSIVTNSGEKEVISLNFGDDKTEIKAARSQFKLASLPPGDFPLMEVSSEEGAQIEVRAEDLHFLIEKTAFSMAQNDARYYLNGTLLMSKDGMLQTVATDGHRLAVCQIKHAGGSKQDARVILPRRAIQELKRILPQSENTVSIHIGKAFVRIRFGETTMTMKPLEESKYPDYKRVMPSDFMHVISIDSEELRQTLAKARVVDERSTRLCFSKNMLKLVARSEQDEAEIEQEIEYSGEAFELGLNPQYLAEVLGVIGSERVLLELKDPNSAIQIRESDSETAKYVVMPLRL